jgi:hypothetical protein
VIRRRRRRRIVIGGAVLLAAGGTAAAIKMSQQDCQRVEDYAGTPVEELTEEELVAAMEHLGIQSIELDENDMAVIESQGETPAESPQTAAPPPPEEDYLAELEKLADLRDRGVITDEDFQAKKKQLLGI